MCFFVFLMIVVLFGVNNLWGLNFLFFKFLLVLIYLCVVLVNDNWNFVFMLIFEIFIEIVFLICFWGILEFLCNIRGILELIVLVIVCKWLNVKFF